jgi:DNA invertase Pin-like site-specific DNA recombinase
MRHLGTVTNSTRPGDLIGYARVSTWDQNADLQVDALTEIGCTRIFTDHASGTRTDRPQLAAALDYARPGDTLVVWRLDRLGRSLRHLVETVSGFEEAGIGFRSLNGDIDTTTSNGRLIFHIFCALAEFERDLLVDRTQAGLAAARARGKVAGRKPKLSADQVAVAQRLHRDGKHNVSEIAKVLGVSRATIYRHLPVASKGLSD